jgi:hypothetical protein
VHDIREHAIHSLERIVLAFDDVDQRASQSELSW